jgi:hypothetical protein
MIWTSEAVVRLRELNALGITSAQIAEIMQLSRNAVHGARFRYGMATPKRPPEPEPIVTPPPVWPTPHQCHWIGNHDPRDPQWCLQRTAADSPYCPEHHARCYTIPIRQREPPPNGTTSDD